MSVPDMWESKFVPDINPETTLEEMEGRAKTLKKLAERKYGTLKKDIQEMVDKTFYEAVDVSIVKEKRKEIEGYTVKYEETLTWLENRYTVQGSSKKNELESIDKNYKVLEERRDAVRIICKEVNEKIDKWRNDEAVRKRAEDSDNTGRRRSRSANRGGGEKQFKQPSGPTPDKISREFTPRQAQDWVNEMNLWMKGCSNLSELTRNEQRTLCKKFVCKVLWTQIVFNQSDDMKQMIDRVHKSFTLMIPAFSRRIQFLNLKMEKGENKLEWAYRLEQAAEMANLEEIKAQELKFLK